MDYLERLKSLLKEGNCSAIASEQSYWKSIWEEYVKDSEKYFKGMNHFEAITRLISEKNYSERCNKLNCKELGVRIKAGDICFIDFGKGYLNEAGFQHFGLILTIKFNKTLVIPMTSNYRTSASCSQKLHLYPLGKIEGMARESTLFLNDARFINSARIIDVKAHIDVNSDLFADIYARFYETIKF